MIKANSNNCQHITNNDDADLSASILDDVSKLCRAADQTRPIPATGSALRDSFFAELDTIEAPAITANFMVTAETPAEVIAALSPAKPESVAIAAVRHYNNSTEAKALREANKAHGHTAQRNAEIDELRTGQGREYHNTTKRAAYAAVIEKTEGRSVRAYTKHETDEDRDTARKERDSIAKRERTANMTPAQKKEESRKRQIRRENAKKREQQALIDQALF